MKKLILGSILAGLAMFVWGFISWMFLGWHHTKTFKNEAVVAAVLKENAPETGVYMLPGERKADGSMQNQDDVMKASQAGPYTLAMVRPGPSARPMASYMCAGVVYNILTAFVLGLILRSVPLGGSGLILFSALIGLFVGLSSWLPAFNWFAYPFSHWAPYLLDYIVQSALAGAVFGKCFGKKAAPRAG